MNALQKIAVTFMGSLMMNAATQNAVAQKPKTITKEDVTPQRFEAIKDSLKHAVEVETMLLMDKPVTVKAVARPISSYENYALNGKKVLSLNFPDENLNSIAFAPMTPNEMFMVDFDELLHAADKSKAEYVMYPGFLYPQLVRTANLHAIYNSYRTCQKAHGYPDSKLYLGNRNDMNAGNISREYKKKIGVRNDIPVCYITTGLLEGGNISMIAGTAWHEVGHDPHEEFSQSVVEGALEGDSLTVSLLNATNIYKEYQSDSVSLAYQYKSAKPFSGDEIAIGLYLRYMYQSTRLVYLNEAQATKLRSVLTTTEAQRDAFKRTKENYERHRSFTDNVNERYPSLFCRMKNLLVQHHYRQQVEATGEASVYTQAWHSLLATQESIQNAPKPQKLQLGF